MHSSFTSVMGPAIMPLSWDFSVYQSLGHRSSFAGAVLFTLPGTHLSRTSPPRILLADPATHVQAEPGAQHQRLVVR
jgi:hypothetical protein